MKIQNKTNINWMDIFSSFDSVQRNRNKNLDKKLQILAATQDLTNQQKSVISKRQGDFIGQQCSLWFPPTAVYREVSFV